jgi:hypothetical protein
MGQLGMQNAENAYQSAMNQYAANQLANQQQSQMGMQLGQMGMQAYGALDKSKYLNSLGGLPSATGYSAYAQPGGAVYQPGTQVYIPQ